MHVGLFGAELCLNQCQNSVGCNALLVGDQEHKFNSIERTQNLIYATTSISSNKNTKSHQVKKNLTDALKYNPSCIQPRD